jgi:polysaccharide export outer membrane protein
MVTSLAPALINDARAQAASDFIAYPKNMMGLDGYNRANSERQLTFNRMPGLSPDYQLGAGDTISIQIVGQSVPVTAKITAAGEVTIPFAGPVVVADLTAEQAETKITDLLKSSKLINNPQVLIDVIEYEAKKVYALGELDRPGEYAVSFQMTLMDLIFVAGGIDFTASRYGYLHRRVSQDPAWRPLYTIEGMRDLESRPDQARPGTEVIRIELRTMKDGGVLDRNLTLRDGDLFYIPRRKIEFAYIIGDVYVPGAFEMPNLKVVTATQAISWGGGPTKTAKMSKGILVRTDKNGQRQEMPVDFAAILAGKQKDVEVLPDDIIFIPGSHGKTVGYGILNTIPTLATYLLIF